MRFMLMALLVLVLAGTAAAERGTLVWYGSAEVRDGELIELAQGYELRVMDIAGSGDGALFELRLDGDKVADGVATSASPYAYTITHKGTQYTILDVEGYKPKGEGGRAGLRIWQYRDPTRELPEWLHPSTFTVSVGRRHTLEQGYSLLASEYDPEEGEAAIEIYSGSVLVATAKPKEGEYFGYVARQDGVHRCILFGRFESGARFNESEPYVLILRDVVQYPDFVWIAEETPTPAPEPLELSVDVRPIEGEDDISAGDDALVCVRVKEPLRSLDIYLDGVLVDSRENSSAQVYTAVLQNLSEGNHTLMVEANATSGRSAIEQMELRVGVAGLTTSKIKKEASGKEASSEPARPPRLPAPSLVAGLGALLLWDVRRHI
ncbi:hypothetical protein [Methermicoccus shengliensis]|uniref:Uncharacterized protein n=1 Tax=Methermicoccus shengliensis TaxID=660064 RepID=A0A832W0G6_9EURY|nr:hypothetical protein [Methermicoccus shengliensis]KUK04120.1 MAG: hypothetical protein XD46_1157 [Euryarchaeota archaeon 55_53]KUK29964.1 MAG: hypothetical protein XD62_0967 [Methanosarcinales archeaon 56_1174]MDI3487982.1 hypothetical protein [Methanosarcinales archaeon]MDN5295578.1 hypothetical protein [Methanosarcinales archaeon]HIH70369.1 hypothetical protein [Methermicoccus shengliensis]